MCGFAGFADYSGDLLREQYLWLSVVRRMAGRVAHRGPDARGEWLSQHCALGHARLSIIDPQNGAQPMTICKDGGMFTIAYNGEIYNADELRAELLERGFSFETGCDTEVVLSAYLCWGEDCAEKLNGIFAFAIDDEPRQRTFLCRDRFGVKPLFYTEFDSKLVFGSEIKALFEYPGVHPVLGKSGICEVFGLGPARTPGCGVFEGICELKPGHHAIYSRDGLRTQPYFSLTAEPHEHDYAQTMRHVRELLLDTVERQLVSDVPLCTFLSGGLDSSVVTAIAAQKLKESGQTLSTYSFEFEDNDKNFTPSSFQPERDEAWAQRVSGLLGTEHTTLYCGNRSLEESLYEGVIAKDLPGMADIDGSLLHYCRQVKEHHAVALCGECADEIFGGYPWFHRAGFYDGEHFPWSNNLDTRESLLRGDVLEEIRLRDYVQSRFAETLQEVPTLPGESEQERRMRQVSYLNIRWFMATLLDRKDRCSMHSGLEVRVPYADHRLAQYVFNTPWAQKCPQGRVKGLLRDAAKGLLPEEILERKKSPYPKTYDPMYEQDLKQKLSAILRDSTQPIHKLLSKEAAAALTSERFDYGKPWFGQLMAGPQLLAYLIQVNYWLLHYQITVKL